MAAEVDPWLQDFRNRIAAIDGRIDERRGEIRKLDENLTHSIARLASRCNAPPQEETQEENIGAR